MKKRTMFMPTTQPENFVDEFQKASKVLGVGFSQWVGDACVEFLAKQTGESVEDVRARLGDRIARGRPSTKDAK